MRSLLAASTLSAPGMAVSIVESIDLAHPRRDPERDREADRKGRGAGAGCARGLRAAFPLAPTVSVDDDDRAYPWLALTCEPLERL